MRLTPVFRPFTAALVRKGLAVAADVYDQLDLLRFDHILVLLIGVRRLAAKILVGNEYFVAGIRSVGRRGKEGAGESQV